MALIYLIRHGKPSSTWGQADPDPGLDALGLDQARAARDWLLARPDDERPRRVVSSPMRRCRETAAPLAEALGASIEIDPAVGEIQAPAELAKDERPAWLRRAFQSTWDGIEGGDYEAWRSGVVAALQERGGTAVFSHFVAINAVVSHLTGDPKVLVSQPDHASITILRADGGEVKLVAQGAQAVTSVL